MQDRIHLPGHIQLLAGGRYDSLRDHNYSLAATSPATARRSYGQAHLAAAICDHLQPAGSLTLYGNYGVLLSLGPQGPWWVDNANQFLAPFFTRQAEVGAKYEPGQRILAHHRVLSHARAVFYPKVIQAPDSFCTASEFNGPGDSVLRRGGPRDARWRRGERGRQSCELAAADCIGVGNSRDL
jgi:iron complex outermembrane receptor protein